MNSGLFSILPLFLLMITFPISTYGQMPDWSFFRDREGNGYYYDRAFKIRITDEKPFDYIPVSASNSDYSLHKGIEFINAGKYREGLYYLKSLKTLPLDNLRVEKNAKESSKWINYLYKKHGDRYLRFDEESTLLFNYSSGVYSLINEKLRYKIVLNKKPRIVKALWKFSGSGYGLKFCFNIDSSESREGYDCVAGVESKILKGRLENLSEAEESWRYDLGRDNLVREEILRREDRVIYTYTYGDKAPFSGIEGIYLNGRYIHIIRIICGNGIKDKVFNEIKKPLEELVLVK